MASSSLIHSSLVNSSRSASTHRRQTSSASYNQMVPVRVPFSSRQTRAPTVLSNNSDDLPSSNTRQSSLRSSELRSSLARTHPLGAPSNPSTSSREQVSLPESVTPAYSIESSGALSRSSSRRVMGASSSVVAPSHTLRQSSRVDNYACEEGEQSNQLSTRDELPPLSNSSLTLSVRSQCSSDAITSSNEKRNERDSPKGLVGLQNLGNTCYMNSCLQCISNLPSLVEYCTSDRYTNDINPKSASKGTLMGIFGNLLKTLWSKDGPSSTRPTDLKSAIGKASRRFAKYDQQDAQEFLRFLLDELHEDVNRIREKPVYKELKDEPDASDRDVSEQYWQNYIERNSSLFSDLFCGQLKSEIRCATCNHRSICFDTFWDLSIPLPKKSKRPGMRMTSTLQSRRPTPSISAGSDSDRSSSALGSTLQDCLRMYTEQESLEEDDGYYCSRCKTHRAVSKQIALYRLPSVLVLHLKRFSYSTFSRDKVTTAINIPVKSLDLADYCAQDAIIDTGSLYDLTGIVHHMGTLNGGHYTAECLNSDTNDWYDFNDASVSWVKTPHVSSGSPYILFYKRREA